MVIKCNIRLLILTYPVSVRLKQTAFSPVSAFVGLRSSFFDLPNVRLCLFRGGSSTPPGEIPVLPQGFIAWKRSVQKKCLPTGPRGTGSLKSEGDILSVLWRSGGDREADLRHLVIGTRRNTYKLEGSRVEWPVFVASFALRTVVGRFMISCSPLQQICYVVRGLIRTPPTHFVFDLL